jgi:hypothetical protein
MACSIESPSVVTRQVFYSAHRCLYLTWTFSLVFYFRQLPLISEIKIVQMLEVLCQRLDDEVVEVREMAAS